MSIVVGLIAAIGSLLFFLVRQSFRLAAGATRKVARASSTFVQETSKEAELRNAALSRENWYEKSSIICSETVDALLNQKTGTAERIVRSLAAKLGFAGATVGLFSIASIFGTASTGTAISTLSGAAFNSAALYWIGGGVSMALGGWIVFLFSLLIGVISYFIALLTLRKFTGKKRKLKHLDDQEKRVVETLTLIAVSFRKQADQRRRLDPTSASMLHDTVFQQLSRELTACLEKVASWPTNPRERLKKQAVIIRELRAFLFSIVPPERNHLRKLSGAKRANIVPVTILKLLSNPVPSISAEEMLVLEALRRTNKRKLKKASLEVLSEYARLERIDRLADQIEKVKRGYRKLTTRSKGESTSEEYVLAFEEDSDGSRVQAYVQNLRSGETCTLKIQWSEHSTILHQSEDREDNEIGADFRSVGEESEILENLSIATMITLAQSAGAFLRGQAISKQRQRQLARDGVVLAGVAGLSQLLM